MHSTLNSACNNPHLPVPPDDLLPLSALQHLLFCERQCALIHVEKQWADNRLTAEGQVLHAKANDPGHETKTGVRVARALPLRSDTMAMTGIADIVEFHQDGTVVPVEYKRGKPKAGDEDRVQICAQSICLEEMLGVEIESGYLFYGKARKRTLVVFDERLRATTRSAAERLHQMVADGETPPAVREKKCDSCSLLGLCMPDALRFRTGAASWLDRQLDP